jgi:hypothetical protein
MADLLTAQVLNYLGQPSQLTVPGTLSLAQGAAPPACGLGRGRDRGGDRRDPWRIGRWRDGEDRAQTINRLPALSTTPRNTKGYRGL